MRTTSARSPSGCAAATVRAMARRSAGILLHRAGSGGGREVLLVHPGGPLWAKRDLGAWSIPKGEHGDDEDSRACALREVEEETGGKRRDNPAWRRR